MIALISDVTAAFADVASSRLARDKFGP